MKIKTFLTDSTDLENKVQSWLNERISFASKTKTTFVLHKYETLFVNENALYPPYFLITIVWEYSRKN